MMHHLKWYFEQIYHFELYYAIVMQKLVEMIKNLPEILRSLRISSNLTQKQVADKLGVIQQTYQAYELGACLPSLEKFVMLAEIFDVSLDYLIGRKEY